MTAAVPVPRFRDQLAEALEPFCTFDNYGGYQDDEGVKADARAMSDALMPAIAAEVEARVQAAANQRAAEELERAAAAINEQRWRHRNGLGSAREAEQLVRARAAALAQPAAVPDGT